MFETLAHIVADADAKWPLYQERNLNLMEGAPSRFGRIINGRCGPGGSDATPAGATKDVMNMVFLSIGIAIVLIGCATVPGGESQTQKRVYGGLEVEEKSPERKDKVVLSDAEWKRRLKPEQYRILRNKGTEAAFCSPLNDVHKPGVFHCAGCDLPLFATDAKFTSGTGWPSFFQPVERKNVWLKSDFSYGMDRIEVLCSRCDGHLGHLFNDGPRNKTGNRFCINGESLIFREKKPTADES